MVALVNPTALRGPAVVADRFDTSGTGALVGGGATATARHHASRTPLRLVDSPPRESNLRGVPVAGIAVAVAVVFGLLLAVRISQGGPPTTSWAELTADSRVSAQALADPGDHLYVAQPGDTFWALAMELAPDADPRPIVDLLVSANGGASIEAGQTLIIPAELVD